MAEFRLESDRLLLRTWRAEEDLAPFHAVCSDPQVMATLGPVMSRDEVAALIARMQGIEAEHGHCFWAMVRRADGRLIGWCGAIRGTVGPVEGKLELGWRMAADCWGAGYASEAARMTLAWLFANRADEAAYAITNVGNRASRAVMERIGMTRLEGGDFDHPKVPEGDPLRPHVTYRITRAEWERP